MTRGAVKVRANAYKAVGLGAAASVVEMYIPPDAEIGPDPEWPCGFMASRALVLSGGGVSFFWPKIRYVPGRWVHPSKGNCSIYYFKARSDAAALRDAFHCWPRLPLRIPRPLGLADDQPSFSPPAPVLA